MIKLNKIFDQSPVVTKYYLVEFLLGLDFFNAIMLPFFFEWGGISFTQTMILQSWFSLWLFILEVPTGAVADHLSRRLSIMLGSLVVSLAAWLYGSVPGFYYFLAAEFLFALGVALLSGACEAWLYDSLVEKGREKEAKAAIGKAHSFYLAGMMVAAPIGGLAAQLTSLNVPMLLAGTTSFAAFLLAATLKEPQTKKSESEARRYLDVIRQGFRFFKQNGVVKWLMLDAVIVAVSAYYVIWMEQAVLKNVGVALKWFGLIQALMLLSEIVISSHFAWFDRQMKKLPVNYAQFSAAMTLLGFMLIFVFRSRWAAVLFIMLSGGFGITREKYMSGVLHGLIKSEQRATIVSALSMFKRMAAVVFNPVFGWLAEQELNWALLAAGLLPALVYFLPDNYALQSQKIKDNNH